MIVLSDLFDSFLVCHLFHHHTCSNLFLIIVRKRRIITMLGMMKLSAPKMRKNFFYFFIFTHEQFLSLMFGSKITRKFSNNQMF